MASNYITAEGKKRLVEELERLRFKVRPDVVKALSAAAAEGDRSENAEYIYRKKQLREIDRRLRYLIKRTGAVVVVDRLPEDRDKVFFGAYVTVEDDDSEQQAHHRIVGVDEVDVTQGWISVDSPMARALLGKRCGDEFVLKAPGGERFLTIISVTYSDQQTPSIDA